MDNFKVTIVEDNGEIHIYTNATHVRIADGDVGVVYDGEKITHQLGDVDEINIKPNR